MNNFDKDWKHYDTAERMNPYQMIAYSVYFAFSLLAVIVVPFMWAAS